MSKILILNFSWGKNINLNININNKIVSNEIDLDIFFIKVIK